MNMILILLVSQLILQCYGLNFGMKLNSYQQHCFSDNLGRDTMFSISILGDSQLYSFWIEKSFHRQYEQIYNVSEQTAVRYSQVVQEKISTFKYCLQSKTSNKIIYNITYLTGSEIADLDQVAKKEDVQEIEKELNRMSGLHRDIQREQRFIMDAENINMERKQNLSRKVVGFALLSVGAFMLVSFCNIHQMKRIFKEKKIN